LSGSDRAKAGCSKVALLTSGGDAPGMNAAVAALCLQAEARGWSVLGIREGFAGLLRAQAERLTYDETLSWARHGGSRLGTSRLEDFPGRLTELSRELAGLGADKLVVLGGNGSLAAAGLLSRFCVTVGIPATIDNDVAESSGSIGFDTAVNSGLSLLDAMRDSAEALPRIFALETLGGNTGFLAKAVGTAGGADAILVPELPTADAELLATVSVALERRRYSLIVASEGYPDLAGALDRLSTATGLRVRASRIGHAQRGGSPSAADRLLAADFARGAIAALAAGTSGRLVWQGGRAELRDFVANTSRAFSMDPD
jgi:6-phosphofructokinase 1